MKKIIIPLAAIGTFFFVLYLAQAGNIDSKINKTHGYVHYNEMFNDLILIELNSNEGNLIGNITVYDKYEEDVTIIPFQGNVSPKKMAFTLFNGDEIINIVTSFEKNKIAIGDADDNSIGIHNKTYAPVSKEEFDNILTKYQREIEE